MRKAVSPTHLRANAAARLSRKVVPLALIALMALYIPPHSAHATDGNLDTTFGAGGKVTIVSSASATRLLLRSRRMARS